MGADGYLVVANIPYYITSVIIRHLLEARLKPARIVLTIQRDGGRAHMRHTRRHESAGPERAVYGKPSIAARIPAGAFYHLPRWSSAVVRVDLYPQPLIPLKDGRVLPPDQSGFSQKRKTLRNSLTGGLAWKREQVEAMLTAAGIDPMRRAETLSLDEWNRRWSTIRLPPF
jgi:16S rRNA (adenine1518-N6/adenine1519-N6)-dimethyltransferase